MLGSMIRIGLGIGATAMIAAGAIAIGNDRYDDGGGALAQACAGSAPSRQLDNALFTARALSDSGADTICAPPDEDDDFDGVTLSHSPSARAGTAQLGLFGGEIQRVSTRR
jgi:hypothetical protein